MVLQFLFKPVFLVKTFSPFRSVEYETFDILEDGEVSSVLCVLCLVLTTRVWSEGFRVPLVSVGSARVKNVLQLADVPPAVREGGAHRRPGHCEGKAGGCGRPHELRVGRASKLRSF